MLSFGQTRHLGISSDENNPLVVNLEFPDEDSFCHWLAKENEIVEWCLTKLRSAPYLDSNSSERLTERTSKRGRPKSIERTKYFLCSFTGVSRAQLEGTCERTRFRHTRKVGCTAKIRAQKLLSSDTVFVTHNSHDGHIINDLKTWNLSRISLATRSWLEKAVASGIEWKDLKMMTRNEVERAGLLGDIKDQKNGPLEVPDILRISNQDFNNVRRRLVAQTARLHSDCRQSLSEYAKLISQGGGLSTLQDVPEERINDSGMFLFAFSSNWLIETLLRYNSLLFLDATHYTCISLEDRNRKAFLYTILVKHDVAGCGISVAFMIINSETQWPLTRWLNWLRTNHLIPVSPKFMIDCSATEMAVIESSCQNPQICLCFSHMLRSIRTQVNSKIKKFPSLDGQSMTHIRKSAVQEFLQLIYSKTVEEFGLIWNEYNNRYYQYEEWVKYLKANWLKYPER